LSQQQLGDSGKQEHFFVPSQPHSLFIQLAQSHFGLLQVIQFI